MCIPLSEHQGVQSRDDQIRVRGCLWLARDAGGGLRSLKVRRAAMKGWVSLMAYADLVLSKWLLQQPPSLKPPTNHAQEPATTYNASFNHASKHSKKNTAPSS